MALKRKITQEEYDALDKVLQAEYTEDGDEFVLDAESEPPNNSELDKLKRAHDRTKQELKTSKAALKEATDKLSEVEELGDAESGKRKRKDIQQLTQAHKEEIAEKEKELADKLSKRNAKLRDTIIRSTSETMAAQISTMPKLMSKEIRERLEVEFDDDGESELVILDRSGKKSAMTLEQLQKEIVANKEFASIIIGSKASGGNAARKSPEQRPSGAGASDTTSDDLSKLSGKDLAARLKAQKESAA